ncbi:hypothetical protein RRG08_062406 [Elysia crispata]|uniref:Uncharacterized protein n=1 Tax=Elysia crispata TaxID=231223 RepID=A0AAE1E4X3_9GAST|nr:hypothetical protein RRG08_062406 [Elysia crispata]
MPFVRPQCCHQKISQPEQSITLWNPHSTLSLRHSLFVDPEPDPDLNILGFRFTSLIEVWAIRRQILLSLLAARALSLIL